MHHRAYVYLFTAIALLLMGTVPSVARADIILDFSDIPVPPDGPQYYNSGGPYVSQGFKLSATGGFNVNGANAGFFYAGETGLAAIAGSTITLTQVDGNPFTMISIDLARNFSFDPAPTVTFTGTYAGGGAVTQTFSVTTPPGPVGAFQQFNFINFVDVTQVTWSQPALLSEGLHQFTDVAIVPEPSTLVLSGIAALFGGLGAFWRGRRFRPTTGGTSDDIPI
jgi:hypothetical protein